MSIGGDAAGQTMAEPKSFIMQSNWIGCYYKNNESYFLNLNSQASFLVVPAAFYINPISTGGGGCFPPHAQ